MLLILLLFLLIWLLGFDGFMVALCVLGAFAAAVFIGGFILSAVSLILWESAKFLYKKIWGKDNE